MHQKALFKPCFRKIFPRGTAHVRKSRTLPATTPPDISTPKNKDTPLVKSSTRHRRLWALMKSYIKMYNLMAQFCALKCLGLWLVAYILWTKLWTKFKPCMILHYYSRVSVRVFRILEHQGKILWMIKIYNSVCFWSNTAITRNKEFINYL